jgi:replicative DNA helicase
VTAEVLTAQQIAERMAARKGGLVTPTPPTPAYKHVRPFADAADGLIDYLTNPEGRFMLGYRDLDAMIRGFGRGELAYITGRAHSGKTQLLVQAIANNPGRRVLFFTPDEVAELILTKLVSISYGLNAEDLEARIKQGDSEAATMVRKVASEEFANLLVIDDSLGFTEMTNAVNEAEDYWGAGIDAVVIDFLELLPGEGEHSGVVTKSQTLKRWTKNVDAPVLCLHQASRSSGARGQGAGMDAMRYGGETEALYVIEVFRKREDKDLDEWDRRRHENTLTASVVKNKRPPCKTGEVDLFIHPNTGQVRTLRDEDMVLQYGGASMSKAEEALEVARQMRGQQELGL